MDENEVKDELRVVLSELVTHLSRGWFWRMARADRISDLQQRRVELLAILVNFNVGREKSSATPSAPRGGEGSGAGSEGA